MCNCGRRVPVVALAGAHVAAAMLTLMLLGGCAARAVSASPVAVLAPRLLLSRVPAGQGSTCYKASNSAGVCPMPQVLLALLQAST